LKALQDLLDSGKYDPADFAPVIDPLFTFAGWGGIARSNARVAEELMVRIGPPATPLLRRKLRSEDAHDRRVAVELFVRIGPREATLAATLRPLLKDPDGYVRKAAIEGLGAVGPAAKDAIDDLERVASEDPLMTRRVGSRIALIQVAGASDERVQALAACLELKPANKPDAKGDAGGPDDGAAAYAASALGDLGPKARAAVPQLRAALNHADPQVRAYATQALQRITESPQRKKP
jgi:HEAT repeat protein